MVPGPHNGVLPAFLRSTNLSAVNEHKVYELSLISVRVVVLPCEETVYRRLNVIALGYCSLSSYGLVSEVHILWMLFHGYRRRTYIIKASSSPAWVLLVCGHYSRGDDRATSSIEDKMLRANGALGGSI